MRPLPTLFVLAIACLGTGCATLRGDKQKVKFETDPPGATLTVGDQTYVTPAEVTLKRKETAACAITLAGYQPISFNMKANWDGASLTDLAVPGGSILMGLALISGSDRKFDPLARIKLTKTTERSPTTVELFQKKDKLLTREEFERAQEK